MQSQDTARFDGPSVFLWQENCRYGRLPRSRCLESRTCVSIINYLAKAVSDNLSTIIQEQPLSLGLVKY